MLFIIFDWQLFAKYISIISSLKNTVRTLVLGERDTLKTNKYVQGGGRSKITKSEHTSFMDDPMLCNDFVNLD